MPTLSSNIDMKSQDTSVSSLSLSKEDIKTVTAELKIIADKVPKHIAVIMDGNRRFGRQKHSNPMQGHWTGGQTLVDFIQWCIQDGVEILTVYAFSSENWKRDPSEVATLMNILIKYAHTLKSEATTRNIKVNILSTDFARLPTSVQEALRELEEVSSTCTTFTVNICLSYGSRAEIVSACKAIAAEVQSGEMTVDEIDEETISNHLLTKSIPEPDILIRTSGEFRLSNFLLWQLAYTELFFIPKLWPEVTQEDLRSIFNQYSKRNRRYGQ